MADSIDIVVPDLGDFSDVEVIEVLVGAGDRVAREDGLITLETDKASMDVPSPEDGVIESLSVSAGDRINSGDVIGKMSVEKDGGDKQPEEDASSGEQDEQDEQRAGEPTSRPRRVGGEQTLEVPDIGDFEDVEVIEVHVEEGQRDQRRRSADHAGDGQSVDGRSRGGRRHDQIGAGLGRRQGFPGLVHRGDRGGRRCRFEAGEVCEVGARREAGIGDEEISARKGAAEAERTGGAVKARQAAADQRGRLRTRPREPVGTQAGARTRRVDLAQVKGSGPKNRVLHDDVKAFVKAILSGEKSAPGGTALPQTPKVDFAKFGEIELQPLTRIQKISGPRLQASWINLPHVTQHDLADITDLEARRQKLKGPAKEKGISLTPLAFIIKACVAALQEFPKVNASLSDDGENLVLKKYCHLGFAADTDQGLVVPVIRDADQKDVYELAKELADLSLAAREGKLKADQMQGATFTVSSLGGIGGTAFTPIVNAPEVAILGVSRSLDAAGLERREIRPRLMLPLSFSYDHRVIDGAMAVRFTTFLGETLGDVDGLLQAIP